METQISLRLGQCYKPSCRGRRLTKLMWIQRKVVQLIINKHCASVFIQCLPASQTVAAPTDPFWIWRRVTGIVCVCLPCFLAVRVMVSLKVLQLELSPPHTPHLSSCFEEPTTPSQPTFCSRGHGDMNPRAPEHTHLLSSAHKMPLTSHSPRTHTLCGSLYEQRVPSRTILCMKTTSRVSLDWQCRWQRLLAGKQTTFKMTTSLRKAHSPSILRTGGYSWCCEWAPRESAWRCASLCLSAWVILQLHDPQ